MRATALLGAVALALGVAGLALAQQPPPPGDAMAELSMDLTVGERKSLCPCPVSGLVCDDPSIVRLVEGPGGTSLEGVKPGTTVCSLYGPNRIRRTYRVTVRRPDEEKDPGSAKPAPAPGDRGR